MTRPLPSGKQRMAFTLVEVLAALMLVAIVLPVAMRGISLATSAAGKAKRQMEAASLAEAKLAELIATGEWQSSDLSGDFGEEWPQYSWSAEVSESDETVLRQLDIRVEWTARGHTRDVVLTTLVYSGSQ